MIDKLYAIEVPVDGNSRTTYNVGMISGGTSVNTIAQYAEMYYEYRSDSKKCMQQMETLFSFVVNASRLRGVDVAVEKIGDRPCGNIAPEKAAALKAGIETSIREVLQQEAVFGCGSTDANMPLSMGIPSACISVCDGGGCHTREEWLDTASLTDGCRLLMDVVYGCE
jgi:acetylornithine deacetylase/succinyl-diaminopimelate desuccinylase-like protein